MHRTAAIFLMLSVLAAPALAGDIDDLPQVKALSKGMPPDVAALISRIVECNHWGGEDPYDKERADDISRAVEKAGCDRVEADEKALREKYKAQPPVLEAIDKANKIVI
jgi:hypothetical protein